MFQFRHKLKNSVVKLLVSVFLFAGFSTFDIKDASAVPSFARKYDMSCNACHTRQPRLNPYGQRFLENGYQLPGTADGGRKEKHLFGGEVNGVTLDDISNLMAFRVRADVQQASYEVEADTESSSELDIVFPNVINMFVAGTITQDISFFGEVEYATREGHDPALRFERSFMAFDNIGGQQVANVKVGVFDPSAMYSFPTHRQQINPIPPEAHTDKFPPEINRMPLLPMAFSSKMFGMTRGASYVGVETPGGTAKSSSDPDQIQDDFSILPFEPFLYNAPYQTGMSVHGRPFGNSFLYQVGVVQKKDATAEAKTRFDSYVMMRYDWLGEFSNFQVSGFYYSAPKAAMPTVKMGGTLYYANDAIDWNRYGLAARWQYKKWDIYGTVIWDEIDLPDFSGKTAMQGGASTWNTSAMGISLEADYLLSEKWLIGARYDQMDSAGLLRGSTMVAAWDRDMAQDASFLALVGKYYPKPNVGLYARYHHNLASSVKLPTALGGGEHPTTNLTSMIAVGVDMAF